ncbi:hypothetical protein D3C87_176090 [compost metagenome]
MIFEWDDQKAEINLKKHGIHFTKAVNAFFDERALEIMDPDSPTEERWVLLGRASEQGVLVVVYCERELPDRIRIISARKASLLERKNYSFRGCL